MFDCPLSHIEQFSPSPPVYNICTDSPSYKTLCTPPPAIPPLVSVLQGASFFFNFPIFYTSLIYDNTLQTFYK